MAAYGALVSLINNIKQIMNHPHLSLGNDQIESLQERTALLLGFIEGYNYGGVTMREEAEGLERRISSTAHAAEDLIESHIVGQIHARSRQPNLACPCSTYLQQIIEDMGALLIKANEFKEKEGWSLKEEEAESSYSKGPLMETGGNVIAAAAMVGFKDELFRIMDELTNQQSSLRTISIVGMGGIGKTTIAQNVYQNPLIKQHFDIRLWVTVSQTYNVEDILSQLLSSIGKSVVNNLGHELYKCLSGRRYMIILDDIWNVKAWDDLRDFFPDTGSSSRVVLTTRFSNVANDIRSSCFALNLLDKHESWQLFCEKAFQQNNCPYPELEESGKEIVYLCKGLPLSIVVIGGSLLKSPRSLEHWKTVAEHIKLIPNSEEKQESLDVVFSSYNHLPPRLKPCFLHVGVLKSGCSRIRVVRS